MTNSKIYMQQILFDFADSILEKNSAIYVAGPLDSGKEFFEFLAKGTLSGKDIRTVNQTRLTEFARHLRRSLNRPVIDPGILRVSEWNGSNYGDFFIEIINRYATEVWFINGWEFSHGGTKEFIHCLKNGVPCFDETGQKISENIGFDLIKAAVNYIEVIGVDASKLRTRLTALKS